MVKQNLDEYALKYISLNTDIFLYIHHIIYSGLLVQIKRFNEVLIVNSNVDFNPTLLLVNSRIMLNNY